MRRGQDLGPGTRDQGPGTRDQGPRTKEQGRRGLQKAGALPGSGQRAGGESAPDAVAAACDDAVGEVTERARDEAQEAGREGPGTGQLGEHDGDGGGAGVQRFGWRACGAEDEDGAGAGRGRAVGRGVWREAVAGEHCSDGGRAGRRKAQAIVAVAGEEPADGAIAEAAVAVVDDEQARAESGGEVQGLSPAGWMMRCEEKTLHGAMEMPLALHIKGSADARAAAERRGPSTSTSR